jgi:hypothetical protein
MKYYCPKCSRKRESQFCHICGYRLTENKHIGRCMAELETLEGMLCDEQGAVECDLEAWEKKDKQIRDELRARREKLEAREALLGEAIAWAKQHRIKEP